MSHPSPQSASVPVVLHEGWGAFRRPGLCFLDRAIFFSSLLRQTRMNADRSHASSAEKLLRLSICACTSATSSGASRTAYVFVPRLGMIPPIVTGVIGD